MAAAKTNILFAGGGSGGHISPGLAIAEQLEQRDSSCRCVFACSSRAVDSEMLSEAEVIFHPLPATPPSKRPLAAIRFLKNYAGSVRLARQLIADYSITEVVALGGFVAAPVVTAAQGIVPVTLLNLDAPPGKANRLMAKRCERVWTAVELPMMPQFAEQVVGMPIRRRALAPGPPEDCRRKLGLEPKKPLLLVTGASQGATSINQMMIALAEKHVSLFESWQILHLTGTGAEDEIEKAYRSAGIAAMVKPFLNHIGLAWGAADVAISRAGASSVAEAAANVVPTVFMPYPHHRDQHQLHNARPLQEIGGAAIVTDSADADANAEAMLAALKPLIDSPAQREQMRETIREHAASDAAAKIAMLLLE